MDLNYYILFALSGLCASIVLFCCTCKISIFLFHLSIKFRGSCFFCILVNLVVLSILFPHLVRKWFNCGGCTMFMCSEFQKRMMGKMSHARRKYKLIWKEKFGNDWFWSFDDSATAHEMQQPLFSCVLPFSRSTCSTMEWNISATDWKKAT